MELFRQLDDGQTDRQTDGLTELFLKSLSQLKSVTFHTFGHTSTETFIVSSTNLYLESK